MHNFAAFAGKLLLSAVLAAGICGAVAQEPTPKPEKKPKAAEKDAKADAAKGEEKEPEFDIPVAAGVPVKGIKIPYYGEDGQLQMQFMAEVATKIDDKNIEMSNLKIDIYDDDRDKFYVEMPSSVFNLDSRVLTGTNVRIKRDDFDIVGDEGEFLIKTKFGKLTGNVKMIIFSAEKLEKK